MGEETYQAEIICPNCNLEDYYTITQGETILKFLSHTDEKCSRCYCYLNLKKNV